MNQPLMFDPPADAPRRVDAKAAARREYRSTVLARQPAPADWRPSPPPELNGERHVILNAETTGLQWWGGDRPVGWSYWLPESGRRGYLPVRHEVGPNLDLSQVQTWLSDLRNVHIENANTKFDLHVAREDGVDLIEGTGNTFGDVAHHAALLDDHRFRFNLDQLSADLLGWDIATTPLGKIPSCIEDESEFRYLHPALVEPYAVRNVEQVHRLHERLEPHIDEENLRDVLALEQDVIPVVVEMERNGTHIDVELLHKWREEVAGRIEAIQWDVYRQTGVQLTSFDSAQQLARVFAARGIPVTAHTERGAPSFTDGFLKTVDDPCVKLLRTGGQLADLDSKYLSKYADAVRPDGWLRFNLHQLRTGADEDGARGTVSGRFSGAGDKFGGYNPQQVVAVEKQLERGWCPDYVVRKLFKLNFAADMMQVEYRLFAHYAKMHQAFHAEPKQKMIGGKLVWIAGPLADFHALVSELLLPVNPSLNRKLVKNINFAMIYGAGLLKFAYMLGFITQEEFKRLGDLLRQAGRDWQRRREIEASHPGVVQAQEVRDVYLGMFPAVQPLLKLASRTAEERGWVETLMGRRARLAGRYHSALNRVIQGGAADINKRVLVEVYKVRKQLGLTMCLTVHDELAGNLADPGSLPEVERVLNAQYFDLRAPILWECKTGDNWAECK